MNCRGFVGVGDSFGVGAHYCKETSIWQRRPSFNLGRFNEEEEEFYPLKKIGTGFSVDKDLRMARYNGKEEDVKSNESMIEQWEWLNTGNGYVLNVENNKKPSSVFHLSIQTKTTTMPDENENIEGLRKESGLMLKAQDDIHASQMRNEEEYVPTERELREELEVRVFGGYLPKIVCSGCKNKDCEERKSHVDEDYKPPNLRKDSYVAHQKGKKSTRLQVKQSNNEENLDSSAAATDLQDLSSATCAPSKPPPVDGLVHRLPYRSLATDGANTKDEIPGFTQAYARKKQVDRIKRYLDKINKKAEKGEKRRYAGFGEMAVTEKVLKKHKKGKQCTEKRIKHKAQVSKAERDLIEELLLTAENAVAESKSEVSDTLHISSTSTDSTVNNPMYELEHLLTLQVPWDIEDDFSSFVI